MELSFSELGGDNFWVEGELGGVFVGARVAGIAGGGVMRRLVGGVFRVVNISRACRGLVSAGDRA